MIENNWQGGKCFFNKVNVIKEDICLGQNSGMPCQLFYYVWIIGVVLGLMTEKDGFPIFSLYAFISAYQNYCLPQPDFLPCQAVPVLFLLPHS